MRRLIPLVSVALFLSLAAGSAAALAATADEIAIRSYVLSMDKVNRYIAATVAMQMAAAADPTLAQEQELAENEPSETLADLRAKLTKHPRLFSYYQRHGLSADEAIMLPLAVVNAQIFVEGGVPPDDTVSPAQLDFVRQNRAAITEAFSKITQ